MKILITTDLYKPAVNGVVSSLMTLREELRGRGHDVRILTLGDKQAIAKESGVYYLNSIKVGKIYPGARISLPINHSIIREIIDWAPDIIHTQCEFSTFHAARTIAKALDIPIVHTYHTVYEDYTHYFSPSKATGKKIVSVVSYLTLRATDAVIAPSKKVERLLRDYGVDQTIEIIPTGIKLARFQQALPEEELKAQKRALGLSDDQLVLVSIGRLAKEKNLQEIIAYLARLQRPDLRLLVVGDGPYRGNLEAEVSRYHLEDQVIFTGKVAQEDVARYYQLGDIFVSGSTSETQGLTYIEALASGRPALCRADDCLEAVLIDGYNGYQYHDFDEFAAYLDRLQDQGTRRRLGSRAANYVQQNFSSKVFGLLVESVYQQVLNKRQFAKNQESRADKS
ncbi:glycosyltransferase family 4 protein [Aerococcus sanguinicola]